MSINPSCNYELSFIHRRHSQVWSSIQAINHYHGIWSINIPMMSITWLAFQYPIVPQQPTANTLSGRLCQQDLLGHFACWHLVCLFLVVLGENEGKPVESRGEAWVESRSCSLQFVQGFLFELHCQLWVSCVCWLDPILGMGNWRAVLVIMWLHTCE